MPDQNVYQSEIRAIDRFLESIQEMQSPFDFATSLVQTTAQQYKADIASLFRVTPSRTELIAEAGYDQRGAQLRANASYYLNWDAQSEAEMPGGGLTAWVAVSGRSLFIRNASELLDRRMHPAHRGVWDPQLHPRGAEETFGCLYAVPLRVSAQRAPRESVVGVYKIERRRQNAEGVFTPEQLADFEFTSKQISLVILLYERALQRVLSDARHGIGPLEDMVNELDRIRLYADRTKQSPLKLSMQERLDRILENIESAESNATKIASRFRQSMLVYTNPHDTERRTIAEFLRDTVDARRRQQYTVYVSILPDDGARPLQMTLAQAWDLNMLLLCLIDNAHEHSNSPDSTRLIANIACTGDQRGTELSLTVSDSGTRAIPADILRQAQEGGGDMPAERGTGLKRVYRVSTFRAWPIDASSTSNGTSFKLRVRMPERFVND